MCMCVWMCVYVCVCVNVCANEYTHVHLCICIYVHVLACACVLHVHMHVLKWVCMCMSTHTQMYMGTEYLPVRCLEFLDFRPSSRKTNSLLAGYTLQMSLKMLRTSLLTLSLESPTWQIKTLTTECDTDTSTPLCPLETAAWPCWCLIWRPPRWPSGKASALSGRSRVRIPLALGFFRGRVIPVT